MQYGFTLSWMWKRLSDVTGSPHAFGVVVWTGLVLAAITLAIATLIRRSTRPVPPGRERLVTFCLVALVVGAVAYAGFLELLSYHTQPWYYLSLVTFVGLSIDPILSGVQGRLIRPWQAGAAALFLVADAAVEIIAVACFAPEGDTPFW